MTKTDTAAEQRAMILGMYFEDADAERFLAIVKHAGIDIAECGGDPRKLQDVIAGHYRIKRGVYDIDRVARDLATFPPVAARIKELQTQKGKC